MENQNTSKKIKKEINMLNKSFDNIKINDLRRAAQTKIAKDRVRSNRMIFMLKRPKPEIIQQNIGNNSFEKISNSKV